MKKQLSLFFGAALFSSMAFAQGSLQCTLLTNVADKGGYLMPGEKTMTVEARLNKANSLVQGLDAYLKECTTARLDNLELKFCASQTEFRGVYEAGLIISTGAKRDAMQTSASATLGTLVRGGGLEAMSRVDAVSPRLIEKLSAADIEVPYEMRGDSLQVDEAINAGAKKNLIDGGEIATISIEKCELK